MLFPTTCCPPGLSVADIGSGGFPGAKRQARREVRFRDPADSFSPGVPEPAAPDATPSQEFLQLDNELRVTAALADLPPDYQEVIVLRNLQRLPFSEVAERMDRSRPAVQMLWMRAIRKLKAALEEEESAGDVSD